MKTIARTLLSTAFLAGAMSLGGCGVGERAAGAFGSLGGVSGPFSGGGGLRGSGDQVGGLRFRTRVRSASADDRAFTTTTRDAGRNIAAALEVGRVRGVEYCLTRFGGSEIAWAQGPDRAPEQVALAQGGALFLAGRCISR